MGKKRVDQANNLHGSVSDHNQQESQLLHKLSTHFKKLSKTRSRIPPNSALDHHRVPAAASIPSPHGEKDTPTASNTMHACYGSPPSARVFNCKDDYNYYDHHGHEHAVDSDAAAAWKFGQLDYGCSGESDTGTTMPSFAVATVNSELFGGENAFAPDFSAGHNLVHVGFVEEYYKKGFGRGYYLNQDPISCMNGKPKYSLDMLELSSQEDMIQEFLKENLL